MIKFTASGANRVIIGLGLEPENIKRMQDGQPVRVRLSDLGFTGAMGSTDIVIFTGSSREEIEKSVAVFIGPQTIIHREPKR